MINLQNHSHLFVLLVMIIVLAFCGACLYAEWTAQRAVERSQQDDFVFWKARLLPLYEASGFRYNRDPKTKEELFEPLFRLTTPVR